MAAEARVDVHHGAPRYLLGLFDVAATGLADWSEFDEEAECWGVEVRGLSREDLRSLIESSTREIPAAEHRRLHQEASDFVRWGRRGGRRTLALYRQPYFSLLPSFRWGRVQFEAFISAPKSVKPSEFGSSPFTPEQGKEQCGPKDRRRK